MVDHLDDMAIHRIHKSNDRDDVFPGEVADLHSYMPYSRDHSVYRQRHDSSCYFCALLDSLKEAEDLVRSLLPLINNIHIELCTDPECEVRAAEEFLTNLTIKKLA